MTIPEESTHDEWYEDRGDRKKHRDKRRANVRVGPAMGSTWLIGRRSSIGDPHMPFFRQGALAFLIWSYCLGSALAP